MKHKPIIEESLKDHDQLGREYFRKSMISGLKGMIDTSFTYARLAKFHGEFRSAYETAQIYFDQTCRSEIFEVNLANQPNKVVNVDYQSDNIEANLANQPNRFAVKVIYRPEIFHVQLG